jgi:two-component system sensor histidine kinase KdpD
MNYKPGQIFFAAVLSAFVWNFFFIPPYYTLRIGKVEDTMMFGMYFIIASVSGLLISRIKTQQLIINAREIKTNALYNLAKELSSAKSLDDVVGCSVEQLKTTFNAEIVFLIYINEPSPKTEVHKFSTTSIDDTEINIANWVFYNSQKAGRFTDTMPITELTYYPLSTKDKKLGVVGFLFKENTILNNDLESLITTFLSQIAIAIERELLKESTKNHLVVLESEKLYKNLFDSISHELKTPITTILGAVSSFKEKKILQNHFIMERLVQETTIAAERLNRLVENLLDITRLESGNLKPKKEWHSLDDLVNSIVDKFKIYNSHKTIKVEIQNELGLIPIDYGLIEQALFNIIHNSLEYTDENCIINIVLRRTKDKSVITIADNGRGFPEAEIQNLFKKFYRIPGTKTGGTGLGLSIAKGFIEAHGGSISAKNKSTGGAEFIIFLPIS